MNYKELLQRYKQGLVNEEEKQYIQQEIEKYEALEEYLSENIEEEFADIARLPKGGNYEDETIQLKKSVNSRLRKVIYKSVAVVFALIMGVFFVLSPLVDSFYYDPTKVTIDEEESDISFDIHALSELNMPTLSPSTVFVEKEGFGRYDIMYSYSNLFTDEMYNVNQKIHRGKIISTSQDPILGRNMFQSIRFLDVHGDHMEEHIEQEKQNIIHHLQQLNPVSYVSATIRFEKDLNMEELYHLESKYPDIRFIWAGIRTDPSEIYKQMLGIHLTNSGSNRSLAYDSPISKKYPGFFIGDWLVNPVGWQDSDWALDAQAYEHHYMSLLEYVVDRGEIVNILEQRPEKDKFYQSALDYAKEHGVKSYGVLVFGEAEDLLDMMENEEIKGLEFNDALVSKRSIY